MSLNPLNELKRRLDDDKTPLAKRLCLVKNVVQSYHFPTAPKERIVAEWLHSLTQKNCLKIEQLKEILHWISGVEDLTNDLKCKLIQIVSLFLQKNPLDVTDIQYILMFLENSKMSSQLSLQIDNYLTIIVLLLQYLRNTDNHTELSLRIFNNLIKYYNESKKKLDFIMKMLQGENLEAVFSYLDTDCRETVINVCQNILFPINKKTYFISFLQTLIRKDNIEELIAEKGDNIQSVIKIMNMFFEFPKNRTDNDTKFLYNFIDVFVSSFKKENQVIFAFYIMAANALRMEQNFITPAMNLPPILVEIEGKTKRNLCLNMLQVLLDNEIDINVRLTDTFGEKISKVEIKKNFTSFLEAVIMGQLKLEGKVDKTTIQIINVALKLDPILIDQRKLTILPAIMTSKKSSSSIKEAYIEMMNCLLEIYFKLSRGTIFISEVLPSIKTLLEVNNTEQLDLLEKLKEAKEKEINYEKIESKIITGTDLFPPECVILYGKLTSELMFRQNKELLELLQKDLDTYCLNMLEEEFVDPSTTVLTEVLSAILSTFLYCNKMGDHAVPLNIAEDFWSVYKQFEDVTLNKFGQCVLKFNYNTSLVRSFLNLCLNFAQLKLLNIKYSNVKVDISNNEQLDLCDLSNLLPCLNSEQWMELAKKAEVDEPVLVDKLLLAKIIMNHLLTIRDRATDSIDTIQPCTTYLINQIESNPSLLQNNHFCQVLFLDLDKSQMKLLAKCLIKHHLANPEWNILANEAIINNRELLNNLVIVTAKNVIKLFANKESFSKVLSRIDFNMVSFAKENDSIQYFNQISIDEENQDEIKSYINIFKQLQLHYLEENYQLLVIYLMFIIKKSTNMKKIKRTVDTVLQSIYELSIQQPDLYQIFPVEFIFNFADNSFLELYKLKLKNSNSLLIIKSLLELAVKKVRTDSQLVKTIVSKLLKKNFKTISDIESFSDPIFQITCLLLPLIVRQKKAITASTFRSILADLQEKLHDTLLESFQNINFSDSNMSVINTDDSILESESSMAALNAMGAYSLTLSRYCETTDADEIKKLNCLWSGLEFFIQSAIKSIENPESKSNYILSSIQLLNVTLRHIKKLENHNIFEEKDKLLMQVYHCVKYRLSRELEEKKLSSVNLEEIAVTLKFICELLSVECYTSNFVGDLAVLVTLKNPSLIIKNASAEITSRKVFKFLLSQYLKANIVGPKCIALAKLMHRTCRNLRSWIRQHYESDDSVASIGDISTHNYTDNCTRIINIDNAICKLIKTDLESLSEILQAAKKVSLDYKFVDSIFELQHMIHHLMVYKHKISCDISWDSFFMLYDGCVAMLNSLIVARDETLEDRWPCYMQCYRALVASLCERATSLEPLDRSIEEKLAEIAHNVEKLTQSICKRKKHVSRIAAYIVADLCTLLERNAPTRLVRQHLENSVALLIHASDNSYAMPFLKRALAGSAGQITVTNLYTMYKRYHKYTG